MVLEGRRRRWWVKIKHFLFLTRVKTRVEIIFKKRETKMHLQNPDFSWFGYNRTFLRGLGHFISRRKNNKQMLRFDTSKLR